MKNTIMEGDRLIGFRLSYLFSKPERGDVIIFKYPDDEKQNFVKRVIGIPGDVVQIIHGKVYVNGNELDEPYLREPMNDNEEALSIIKLIAVAFIIAFIFTQYIIVNAEVPTGSMKNTIMEGDRLIGFRLSYLFSKPERGDVIIFKYPDDEKQNFVKRVIGIPGDVVQIIHGKVYVNGNELDEPYLREPMNDNEEEQVFVVPEGHYFVMGDNRNDSLDSRYWKTSNYVSEKKILAKVIFRYYNQSRHKINFKLFN